jgi:hypothetical protein
MGWSKENRLDLAQIGKNRRVLIRRQAEIQRGSGCPPLPPEPQGMALLIESVPPRLYGGTERILSYLTEELVRLGHDVTLFASADSITSAELAPCCTRALRLDPTVRDSIPHFTYQDDNEESEKDPRA